MDALSPQNLAIAGQKLLKLSPLVFPAKLMLDGRYAQLLGGDTAYVADMFVRCLCLECQPKEPVYVPSLLSEGAAEIDKEVRGNSSIMSIIDFMLHCRPGLDSPKHRAVVDAHDGGDGLALKYILLEPFAARDGRPMYLGDAMQVLGSNADRNHSLTGRTVYVYHWAENLYMGAFKRAVVREFDPETGNHTLDFTDEPGEWEVNMGLNYVYVCSSPDEPPPPSSDDMSPGLPRVGALVRPEGYDTTRTMDSIPGLPPAAPINPLAAAGAAASGAATHSAPQQEHSFTSQHPHASTSQKATSGTAAAPAMQHPQAPSWPGMPAGAISGYMAGTSTGTLIPSTGGMMPGPAGDMHPGMAAPWQMQGMQMPVMGGGAAGVPMMQQQQGGQMVMPAGGLPHSAMAHPQMTAMAGMFGGMAGYQNQHVGASVHNVPGVQGQGVAAMMPMYPGLIQGQVQQQQQPQMQAQPGAAALQQPAGMGAQPVAAGAAGQPGSSALVPPPPPPPQQQQQVQEPLVGVKQEQPAELQGQPVQQPEQCTLQQQQQPQHLLQAAALRGVPPSSQVAWPWSSGVVCASAWPQDKVFSLPAAAEVVSQFSSDSVGACQVSFHLMRALTSVVNLLYEPQVPYQFMDSWQRLSESEQRELYNKLAQACGRGKLDDILSRRPQIEEVLTEIHAKGLPRVPRLAV